MEQSITTEQFRNLLAGPNEEFEAFFIARPHLLDALFSSETLFRPLFYTCMQLAIEVKNETDSSLTLPKLRFLVSRQEVNVNGHDPHHEDIDAALYHPLFAFFSLCCDDIVIEHSNEGQNVILEVFRILLDRGTDIIHPRDLSPYRSPRTLLFAASEVLNVELVKLLIQYKARINEPNETGFTPLMAAVKFLPRGVQNNPSFTKRRLEILKSLLDARAFIDAQDQSGTTALMCSVTINDIEAFKFLMKRGANLTLTNTYGQTAFDMAEPAFKAQLKPFFKDRVAAKTLEQVQNKKELAGETALPPDTTSIVGSFLGLPSKPARQPPNTPLQKQVMTGELRAKLPIGTFPGGIDYLTATARNREGGRKTRKSRRKTKKRKSRRRKY
jgi:hypothetical protein